MLKLRSRKRHRSRACAPVRASGSPKTADRTEVPEWKTEEWKHRVEAEARRRVKGEIKRVSKHD
jgi:hypothetical protein